MTQAVIDKLERVARDPGATPEERAAYRRKAQELRARCGNLRAAVHAAVLRSAVCDPMPVKINIKFNVYGWSHTAGHFGGSYGIA